MASEGGSTAAAISAAIISSAEQRYIAPEPRRWKGYWTRYWCFKSQKREKRIVPAFQPHGASDSSRGWLPAQAVLALVPPSSPASFMNSSVHSPVAAPANICSPGPPNTSFTIGPYAHETQLVSPPVFSTFTTEPSTAAVTPPPEPHLTTPSSPDVPFAQYIASSLEAKAAARRETISPLSTSAFPSPCDTPASHTPALGHLSLRRGIRDTVSPRSTSTLASPCDTPASYTATSGPLYSGVVTRETISPRSSSTLASPCDTPASYTPKSSHHYLGSPISCLVPPSVECSVKDDVFPAESYMTVKPISPLFRPFNPFSSADFSHTPFATLILPCDDSTSNAENSLASVISEAPNHDDASRMTKPEDALVPTLSEAHMCESLVNSEEASGLCFGSGEELHKGFWQGINTGSMLSEDCSRVGVSFSCQSDTELSTCKLKGNNIFSDGEGMLQVSFSEKVDDEQRDCSSCPVSRNDTDQNTNAENAQATHASSSMQRTDNGRLWEGSAGPKSLVFSEHA